MILVFLKLVERAQKEETKEIILAMNATIDGQTTAYYITDQLAEIRSESFETCERCSCWW